MPKTFSFEEATTAAPQTFTFEEALEPAGIPLTPERFAAYQKTQPQIQSRGPMGEVAGQPDNQLLSSVVNSFVPNPPTAQELRQREIEKAAGVTPIPLGTRIAAGLDTGIRQGLATPGRLVHAGADLAMGAVGAGNTRLGRWNADMLRQYADYEARMQQQDVQTFGPNDIPNQLASGTGRAVTELPLYIVPGMGAASPAQAVARSSAAGGVVGGGTQYAQDRGAGRERMDAATYATASGLITALTTRAFGATGAEALFRTEGIQGIRSRLVAVLKDAGLEGAEEMADQAQQDILERYSRNPEKPFDATVKEVLMAGAVGGLVGGGVSGAVQATAGAADTINDFQANRAFDRASKDAANETALQATFPERNPNQAALDAATKDFNQRPQTFTFEEAQQPLPQSQAPESPDVPKTTDSTEQKTSGAVQATSPASGASTPLTISNIQDSTENQTALPPVERMPSDAGFTHSTMARSYFFDGGPGVMISTGYLANAIAGAFPRASSRLWEVFKANEKAITDTLGDIRTLVVTEHWAKLRAEIVTAVESSYGVNTAEARAILDAMLDNPTGVTFRDGARLENRLDALESEQRLAPTPAKTTPSKQSQVRAELMALPGANEDLTRQVPALTSEQTDAGLREAPSDDNVPATKADLIALAQFIEKGGPNPFAPKAASVSEGADTLKGGEQNGKDVQRQGEGRPPVVPADQPTAAGGVQPTLPPATSSQVDITEAEKTELEALRKKDKSELLEGLEEQRMYELNRKESATKRRSKTASESAALKEAGITVPDSFLNPEPGTENHITGWTKDKNGFIQIRTETHKGGMVSTRLTTLKSGDTLRAGMDDSIKGTTRYDESTSNEPNIQTNPANAAAGNGQEVAQTQVLPQTPQGNAPSGKPVGTIVEPSPGMRYQKQADGVWARLGFDGKPSGRVTAQQAAQFEALPVGQTASSQNPSSQTASKPTKWTPTAGKLAVVNLTGRGKGRLARVLQVQPDGDATVQIKGEDGTRYVKLSQMRATGAEQSRLNRADELAELDPADVESVKQDAAEFDRLVEDYAPQLDWAPGEAYSDAAEGTELRADAVARGELRKAARRNAARAAGIASFQESSLVERAEALPKLEAYLKQQFPGDNSIAKRRVLEQFSRSEADPEQTATVKRDQATLDQLAANRPNKPEFRGLKAVGRTVSRGQPAVRGRGAGSGVLSSAGASTVTELERIFGVRIIFVENARFNGVRLQGTNLVLINAKAPRATLAIAGHELLHHIKAVHPGLYADFVAQARTLLRNSEQFRAELARKGYANLTEAIVAEEMFADVLGDAVLDPAFLQQLAKSEPNLFKRFARTAVKWLEKLIAKAKALTGFDSAQYVTDLMEMRERLLNLLRDAGRQTQFDRAGIQQEATEDTEQGADAFSIGDGDLFGAPESVEEQRARLKAEADAQKLKKAKDAMQERAGARLIGKDLDTTQEMFGAEIKRDKTGQGDMFSREKKQFQERFALAKPIKGPTGASIVGYEWRSTMGEKYSAREGGMVEARISDWDNADESTGTGRSIVHVFYVEHPNGKVHPEGIRSAQTVLGINESRLMTIAKKERAAQQYRQDQERAEMAIYAKAALPTAQEAAREYRKLNYSPMRTFEENNEIFNESALFEKDGKFLRRSWKATERLLGNGWTLVKDDPARTGGTAKAIDSVRETEPESQASGGVQQDMFSLEAGPRWRSNIQSALASWQNKGTPEQLRAHLAKTRGAMDEAEWIGLDEFLKDKPSVTKQQVAEFVQTNTVDVQEVTKGGRRIDDSNMAGEMKDLIADYNRGEIHEGDLKEGGRRLGYTVEMDGQDISSIYENTAGETKFANYQLPGGENYRELLLTLPETGDMAKLPEGYRIEDGHLNGRTRYSVHGPGQGRYASGDTREQAIASFYRQHPSKQTFKSSHFDEANILAHVRFNERTDADGKRVLFIEEVQSDWHQKGRKEGYADKNRKGNFAVVSKETGEIMLEGVGILDAEAYSARNGGKIYDMGSPKIPNAPFKQTWPMLAMKRMIRYASENGFDRIAWTTGEQQAERYDLSKQLSEVVAAVHHKEPDTALVSAYDKNGRPVLTRRVPMKDLPDVVGKDLADKIAAQPKDNEDHAYRGLDLKVGGEGMKGFYDKILPGEVNKFVKKWGGRVGQAKIGAEPARFGSLADMKSHFQEFRLQYLQNHSLATEQEVKDAYNSRPDKTVATHSLDITPAMKAAALEGFDMFSREEGQSEFTKLQADITAAETELMDAIRAHMNPPEGVRKAEALNAKNDAHRKLRALLAQQLKMMTDIRNLDAARSPEETANLISQTVDLLNSIQDDISERNARSEAVPADLTKLRTDLQERLSMLKGWTDAQEDEDRGSKMANGGKQTEAGRARLIALESATDPQHKTFGEWWQTIKNGLRYLTSPIPELPLTGERAEKSALFRRGYRLFAVENNRVRKEAAERVNQVLEPLTKLGRTPASNEALRRYYQLGEARERAAMDPARREAITKQMLALEESTLNKDPFNLFRRLVLYKDLRWRGTYLKNEQGKPITLPMGLTVDEVGAELRRIYKLIEQHPDGLAITEALRRHYTLTDDLQKSILEHGEIIPESLRNPLYFPHHVIDSWSGNIARVRPSTEEDFRKYLIAPTGSAKLIQTDYLKAMYLHTADVLAHNARVDLVDKYWKPYDISEQLKAQHGDKWNLPWNIPPGYKLFTPFNKLPLRMDYVLSREVLADKLGILFNDGDLRERMGDTGRVLKVKPEDLHAAMVAGEKIQWALPAEIADALTGIARREAAASNPGLGHAIGLPFRAVNNFWKKTKLFAPWNWIRYEYGNLSTDAIDKVLAADPGAAKYLSRAAREVWGSGDPGHQATPEFKAAAREGVFDTITAGEAGELTKLPEFKAFLTGNEARWDKVRSFLERPMRGSKFREATFRYAKFLADVERLRAGKEPTYAGAFHGDIEALGEDVDGQRRMMEGDELIYAKAAEISLKTYGDYNSLGVAGQWLRQYAVPFWSWQDVNFRYHANQLRNIADGLLAGDRQHINTARKAALRYAGVRVVSTLVAIGIAKELWNQFGGPLLGLWDDDDDLESKLSEQDRRRGHLLLGKDKDGKVKVVYTPSAWSDVAEWMGGQNMKRLFMEYARGQITLDQFVTDYAKQLPGDVLNKLAQSVGPLGKAPYETISGKSTFPDVLDQRTIPESERWWRLVGTLTDDRAVNVLRAAFDQDYYSQPASEQLQQIILQIRRRDPEQWSYYEAREDAAEWKEAKTGKRFEQGSYDAPEAQALRNFRKSIYRGDVASAERFYTRLLEFGYTAERLDASIRNQDPLSDLNQSERAVYLNTITPRQRQELALAQKYYGRMKALDNREKQLFPKKGQSPNPNPQLLKRIVEDQSRNK